MSEALYEYGGLRFWSEREIALREQVVARVSQVVRDTLLGVNRSWAFHRVEGPILTPLDRVSENYRPKIEDGQGSGDMWVTQQSLGKNWDPSRVAALRPETTSSSYAYASYLMNRGSKLPLCVWQSGKSFRREVNDGASAAKLRFYEFYQLEFQCLYADTTKADYKEPVMLALKDELSRVMNRQCHLEMSDRLPEYSEETEDIISSRGHSPSGEKYKDAEVCSVSLRKDFPKDGVKVLEVAVGLDRVVSIMEEK